jgi:hypothetical protein
MAIFWGKVNRRFVCVRANSLSRFWEGGVKSNEVEYRRIKTILRAFSTEPHNSTPTRRDTMQLKPLYRVTFQYPGEWNVNLAGSDSLESQHFFLAEGKCEGRISGVFRGANHPLRRGDGTYLPNFQGVIETAEGAVIYFDYRGYGRAYPVGRRQVVTSATHLSDHPDYRWLNDGLCVGAGEVRTQEDGSVVLVIDWSELVWEPLE